MKKIMLMMGIIIISVNMYSTSANEYFTRADTLLKNKQYQQAAENYLRAFELYKSSGKTPNVWHIIHYTSMLFYKMNKREAAYTFMIQMKSRYPENPLFYYHFANMYSNAREYQNAIKYYLTAHQLYQREGNKPPLYLFSSVIDIYGSKLKNIPQFRKYLLEALSLYGNDPNLHYSAGNIFNSEKDYPNALKHYNRAYSLYQAAGRIPPIWLVINVSSIYVNHLNQTNDGMNYLVNNQNLYKDEPLFFFHLGNIHLKLKKLRNAEVSFLKAISMYKSQNKTAPMHLLSHLAVVYMFHEPYEDVKAIPYLVEILNYSQYPFIDKEYIVDWLAHGYIKTGNYSAFLKLVNNSLPKITREDIKKKLYQKLANYYYSKELDLKKAMRYAQLAGDDFSLIKILKPKKIKLHFVFHLKEIMRKYIKWIKPGIVHINLPISREYQEILEVKTNIHNFEIITFNGLKYLKLDLSSGFPEKLILDLTIKLTLFSKKRFGFKSVTLSDDPLYKYANERTNYYDIDNPLLIQAVNEITKNKTSLTEKVQAVFKWISQNITHWSVICQRQGIQDIPENWPKFKKISQIYQARKGICTHISQLFVGMMRILKVPARIIGGYLVNFKNNLSSAHVVAEIYDAQNDRWLFIEPQGFIPFGLNAWNHVIFNHDVIGKKPPKGFLFIGSLEHYERWNLSNPHVATFSLSFFD